MKIKTLFLLLMMLIYELVLGQKYQIMTYNIRYDNPKDGQNEWSKRKEYLSSQIAFYEPDVFGIQEGLDHQVKFLEDDLKKYYFVGVGRDDGIKKGEYCAVFYKKDKFEVLIQNTFWLSESPNKISVGWDASMERICTYVLLEDKATKQKIWIFNTHFDHIGEQARIKSSKLIVKKIKILNKENLPVILMGDFNLIPTSKPILFLSQELSDSRTISKSKPFGPKGTFNRFNFNKQIGSRIDYIFVSKSDIQVKKYAVLSDPFDLKYPSDHLPVFIEIKL